MSVENHRSNQERMLAIVTETVTIRFEETARLRVRRVATVDITQVSPPPAI